MYKLTVLNMCTAWGGGPLGQLSLVFSLACMHFSTLQFSPCNVLLKS